MIEMNVFCECHTNIEITIAFASEATEPTDRSKPPTASEIVIPIEIMVTIEIERKILIILDGSKKLLDSVPNTAINSKIVMMVPYLYKKSKKSNDLGVCP
jgi:hypothetical protein